jgi:hypothetical protein
MQSPIYWHPFFYTAAIRLSYGSKFKTRYSALNKYIPHGCHLLELCMGDAFFYRAYLRKKDVVYSCADINPVFVNIARKNGIKCSILNITEDEIPRADYILMQGSLYHFIPDEAGMIRKLLNACNERLIISENVENLSNSSSGLISWIGKALSKAKAGQSKIKFTRQHLKSTFKPFKDQIEVWEESPDNKEVIIVLRKSLAFLSAFPE